MATNAPPSVAEDLLVLCLRWTGASAEACAAAVPGEGSPAAAAMQARAITLCAAAPVVAEVGEDGLTAAQARVRLWAAAAVLAAPGGAVVRPLPDTLAVVQAVVGLPARGAA